MSMKIKAKASGGMVKAKMMIKHPMHTGMVKDKKTGKKIPAKYIQEVVVTSNGKKVFGANLNASVSKDPFLSFEFKGKAGDKLEVTWKDNTGATGKGETVVK